MNKVFELIVARSSEDLSVEQINRETILRDIGIGSLSFLLLILDIQEMHKEVDLSPEKIAEINTVGDILDKIENLQSHE